MCTSTLHSSSLGEERGRMMHWEREYRCICREQTRKKKKKNKRKQQKKKEKKERKKKE
jgi:hypothetical protein